MRPAFGCGERRETYGFREAMKDKYEICKLGGTPKKLKRFCRYNSIIVQYTIFFFFLVTQYTFF